jgi:hypothetical protein
MVFSQTKHQAGAMCPFQKPSPRGLREAFSNKSSALVKLFTAV